MIKYWIKRYFYDQAKEESEFLPSALALSETPPNPAPRFFLYIIFIMIISILIWALFGKTDVVAVSDGMIIPSDKSMQIQVFERAIIKKIHVKDGDFVQKGAVLIECETDILKADLDRTQKEMDFHTAEILRSYSILEALDNNEKPKEIASDVLSKKIIQQANHRLISDYNTLQTALKENETRLNMTVQEIKTHQHAVAQKKKLLSIKTKRQKRAATLAGKDYLPQNRLLEIQEEVLILKNEIITLQDTIHEKNTYRAQLKAQANMLIQQARADATKVIQETTRTINSLSEERIKAEKLLKTTTITAPVSGVIQQLAVNTLGGVLTPAQPVMMIVPQDAVLEAEVNFLNKDIGFLNIGQEAHLKIESFPYTKYGMIEGTISVLSSDAIKDEHLGLIYKGRITLKKPFITVDDKKIPLMPGMHLTAEVKTDQRRLINYFLSPIIEVTGEGFRER